MMIRSWVPGAHQEVPDRTRSQSEVIGFVLVIGMVLLGATAVVWIGTGALGDTQQQLQNDRAEKALAQLDSEAGVVALGSASTRSVDLAATGDGQYHVQNREGWMRVAITNTTGSTTTITNATLGSVSYGTDQTQIAYQGGGVWRASPTGGKMISPPEFHYRNGTLTLPIVQVTNEGDVGDEAVITQNGTERLYPTEERGLNPLTDNKITITVRSQYYQGWGQYFEQRTRSEVQYSDHNKTVSITLVPPPQPITITSGIVAAGDLNIKSGAASVSGGVSLGGTTDDNSSITGTVERNVRANRKLEEAATEIADARNRLNSETGPASDSTVEAGTYFVNDDVLFDTQTTFNTTNGDIEIFVDGDLTAEMIGGKKSAPDLNVTGDGTVKIYVDGEFHMKGQATWGNAGQRDSLLIYSDEVDRITTYHGIIYTDAIKIAGQGAGKGIVGALISTADTVTLTGNSQVSYDPSLSSTTLQEVEVAFAEISYLHITENKIKVD